jgi:hypothetical protein
MPAHVRHAPAPMGRRIAHGSIRSSVALYGAVLLAVLVSGCAGAPPAPVAGAHPADPAAPARSAAYQPVTGSYVRQRPRDPAPWRENNERVTPQEKP